MRWLGLVLGLVACGGNADSKDAPDETGTSPSTTPTPTPTPTPAPMPTPTPSPTPTPTPSPQPTTEWMQPTGGVVTLTTRDGVDLEADYVPADSAGAPGFCLFHMIPPGNDRTNWPTAFVEALADEGWAVLVVDRRGAGNSGGVAIEAYEGPNGKYDVEACAKKLEADGYGPLAVIGASNGTTSMLDYAVWAGGEALPVPVALGYMTGGAYTEVQNDMASAPDVPAIFTYSTAEAAWSVDQQVHDPGNWVFEEYPLGDHGTRMFDAAPAVSEDLIDFFRGVLSR